MNLDLKQNVTGNSSFVYVRDSALWYRTETGLLFPVPVAELDGAQVLATERSLVLMRYIRRYIDSVKAELEAA